MIVIIDDDGVEMIKVILILNENKNEIVNGVISYYCGDDYYDDDDQYI